MKIFRLYIYDFHSQIQIPQKGMNKEKRTENGVQENICCKKKESFVFSKISAIIQ
jgi:hypothetical protein